MRDVAVDHVRLVRPGGSTPSLPTSLMLAVAQRQEHRVVVPGTTVRFRSANPVLEDKKMKQLSLSISLFLSLLIGGGGRCVYLTGG